LATRFWIADDTTSSVFIQGNLVHNDDRLFPNFRVKTSHHADLLASNIVPLMAQQSMVYRFKLRDCGLKKGNCVDHNRWQ